MKKNSSLSQEFEHNAHEISVPSYSPKRKLSAAKTFHLAEHCFV